MKRMRGLPAVLTLTAVLGTEAAAQTIPIRTVPVASGDQFLLLPSETTSMGGVRVAVDDSVGAGWTNPAFGGRVRTSAFIGSPTFYSISRGQGGGRTFPVTGIFRGSAWFGGGSLALQEIDNDTGRNAFPQPLWDVCCVQCCGWGGERPLSERFGRNVFASAYLGRRIGDGWSVGVAGAAATISAMDGVDLLYQGSDRIEQSGDLQGLRLGVAHEGARDRWALMLLHDRVSMVHEVWWRAWAWDAALVLGQRRWVEANEDRTRTWGAHVSWDRALEARGWRVGASGTLNYKDHPKIPNYRIQNIPRDPGTTWAYEAAVGAARTVDRTTYAFELAFQPIWSETWQVAGPQDVAASGGAVGVGDRSIDNDFFFTNLVLRSGLTHRVEELTAQVGLEIRSYAYQLEQVDHVERRYREQVESWTEWMPTFGATLHLSSLDLQYAGRLTTGTGRPGTANAFVVDQAAAVPQGDFLIAPEAPLTLQDVTVMTHQLSVHIPVR